MLTTFPVEAFFEDDICCVCTVRAPQFCILVLILSSPFNTSLPYRPRAACLTCQVIYSLMGQINSFAFKNDWERVQRR
jgi:hypothetical protein